MHVERRATENWRLRRDTTERFLVIFVKLSLVIPGGPSQVTRHGFAPSDESQIFRGEKFFGVNRSRRFVDGIVVLFGSGDDFPRRNPHVIVWVAIEDNHDSLPVVWRAASNAAHATEVVQSVIKLYETLGFIRRFDAFELHHDAISNVPWIVLCVLVLVPGQHVVGNITSRVKRGDDESTLVLLLLFFLRRSSVSTRHRTRDVRRIYE